MVCKIHSRSRGSCSYEHDTCADDCDLIDRPVNGAIIGRLIVQWRVVFQQLALRQRQVLVHGQCSEFKRAADGHNVSFDLFDLAANAEFRFRLSFCFADQFISNFQHKSAPFCYRVVTSTLRVCGRKYSSSMTCASLVSRSASSTIRSAS